MTFLINEKEHVRNQRKNKEKKRKKQLFSKSNHNMTPIVF